jgi:recombination protein RecA
LLVWDSITFTLPEVFVEDGQLKEFDKQKQIGAASRSAGIAINAMHYVNQRTAIVLISQTRTDMSGMYPVQKPTNGKVVEFGSSVMVKLTSNPSEKEQIKGKIFMGDKVHELPVGREVKFDVMKNKVGPPNRAGRYNFYYAGESRGIDNVDELVTLGKRYGVVRASGAWTYFGEEKWNGQSAMVEALKNDHELFASIEKAVEAVKSGEVSDEQLEGHEEV